MKNLIKNYLTFSRQDRNALILLLTIVIGLLVVSTYRTNKKHQISPPITQTVTDKTKPSQQFVDTNATKKLDTLSLSSFDPNTLDQTRAIALGLSPKVGKTIEKYLSKGGKFYKKEDLKKIYGLKDQDYERLAPFIQLPQRKNYKDTYRENGAGKGNFKTQNQQAKAQKMETVSTHNLAPFNPNQLTQAKAIELGLSPKVGKTIEKYLSKGGKFYKKEDLKKIYGLKEADYHRLAPYIQLKKPSKREVDDSVKVTETVVVEEPVAKVEMLPAEGDVPVEKPMKAPPIKLQFFNPNELSQAKAIELGLSPKVGKTIANYLNKGGKFYKKEDLKKIYGLKETDYNRLAPYIQLPNTHTISKPLPKKQDTLSFATTPSNISLSTFNPNKLTQSRAIELGLSAKVGKTIENYLSKGGKFYKKEDLKKIYGLKEADYDRLAPYMELPQAVWPKKMVTKERNTKTINNNSSQQDDTFATTNEETSYEKPTLSPVDSARLKEAQAKRDYWKKYEALKVDINEVDLEKWQELRGIGPSISGRIMKYRDLLGGFTHPEQLLEVYGFSEELFQDIMEKLTNNRPEQVKKLNINQASVKVLKAHPYIEAKVAKKIVRVREKYGKYESFKALIDFQVMEEEELKKLKGYLEY